jgi:hypothetical protein
VYIVINIVAKKMATEVRIALSHSLGFLDYPESCMADPFLNYIENQHHNSDTLQEYLELFSKVVQDFSTNNGPKMSIQTYINDIFDENDALFDETKAEGPRRELITDTILNILGVWITARSYFIKSAGYRQVELAFHLRRGSSTNTTALGKSLPGIIRESGLIPSQDLPATYTTSMPIPSSSNTDIHRLQYSRLDSLETSSIKATTLNAYTLFSLADTRISWTFNFSRHLLLTPVGGHHILEVFALPCALNGKALFKTGIPPTLVHEIQTSYSILFDPYGGWSQHARWGRAIGLHCWCWCRSCSVNRLKLSELKLLKARKTAQSRMEFDPLLSKLMSNPEPENWDHELFVHLWPRIVALDEHLQSAKPWNFWVLFRDRRDTLQFWTFL